MTRTALLVGGAGGTGILLAQGLERAGYAVTILHRGVHEPQEISGFPHIHADPHFAETTAAALNGRCFDLVVLTYGRVTELAKVFAGRCERLIAIGGIPIYAGFLDPRSTAPRGMRLFANESSPLASPAAISRSGAARFAAKLIEAEQAVMAHHASGDYAATIFRYPSVYGPNAIAGSEAAIVRRVLDGRKTILVPFEGLCAITRCSTWNCAHAVLAAIDNPAASGRIFNCADDDQFTLGQWVEMILAELGSSADVVGLPTALNWAAAHLVALGGTTSPMAMTDAGEARRILGYRDAVPAREALARSVRWHLANAPEAGPQWGDPLDYAMEDQVVARLTAFELSLADIQREPEAVHPYPHPQKPGLTVDHRGR